MSLNNPGARQTSALVGQVCSDMGGSTCSGSVSKISIHLVLSVAWGSPQKANASVMTCTCHAVTELEIKSSSSYTSHGGSVSWWQGREEVEAVKTTGKQPASP